MNENTNSPTTTKQKRAITRQQRTATIILGVGLIIFAIWAGIGIVSDGVPLTTQTLTISEANDIASDANTHVKLQEVNVLCDTLEYRQGRSSSTHSVETRYTYVWMIDANVDESVAVFAQYSGRTTCDDIQAQDISGFLTTVGDTLPREAIPLPFGQGAAYMELCTYCNATNSQGMLLLFAAMILFGVVAIYRGLTLPIIDAHPSDKPEAETSIS